LLKCYRYIELNPVAADMVSRPEDYRWSSYHYDAWSDKSDVFTLHREYLPLSTTSVGKRQYQYRELFKINLAEEDSHPFRRAGHYSVPVGSDRFIAQLEEKTGQKIKYSRRGRPRVISD
jgi:putative transposase